MTSLLTTLDFKSLMGLTGASVCVRSKNYRYVHNRKESIMVVMVVVVIVVYVIKYTRKWYWWL